MGLFNFIYQIARSVRPRQWLKNLAVFAAPIFNGYFFKPDVFLLGVKAFIIFCLVSSGVYLINDIVDAPKDKLHPIKKNRPIASGKVPKLFALALALTLFAISISYSISQIGSYFTATIITYIILQMAYSFHFRNIIILDALIVSSGFILRVFAGGFATNVSVSSWLILTTIGLSLLLAFGKRRSEKTILEGLGKESETRKTLKQYPDSLLDSIISMSASFCIISYALFTFQTSPDVQKAAISILLPSILQSPKWMMLTIPFVLYGVARYLFVIYEKKAGESPERVLLSDNPLRTTVILWIGIVFAIIYLLPA